MGYYTQTNVSCTNPEILSSGSTFNQKWGDFLMQSKNGVAYYYCRKEYLNDAIIELSKENPAVTFTGVTWNDSDYYDCIKYTLIIKNGKYKIVKYEPEYQYFFPIIEDDEYKRLAERFREHIDLYLKRLDIVNDDPVERELIDFLNDKEDNEGFKSYCTITWENDEHLFTATKRFTSHIIVDYKRKKPKVLEPTNDSEIGNIKSGNQDSRT
jgi:hypothetical protein